VERFDTINNTWQNAANILEGWRFIFAVFIVA
jgi:hypothetical protein